MLPKENEIWKSALYQQFKLNEKFVTGYEKENNRIIKLARNNE